MTTLDPHHVAWCRNHFDSLREGGAWGFPNAGFVFRKRGDKFILTDRMPWDPKFPMNKAAWSRHQRRWLESTIEHFAAAGIEIIDESR